MCWTCDPSEQSDPSETESETESESRSMGCEVCNVREAERTENGYRHCNLCYLSRRQDESSSESEGACGWSSDEDLTRQ